MLENRMIIDSEWKWMERDPEIIGYCEFCGEEIYDGEDAYRFNDDVLLHEDCILSYLKKNDYISDIN